MAPLTPHPPPIPPFVFQPRPPSSAGREVNDGADRCNRQGGPAHSTAGKGGVSAAAWQPIAETQVQPVMPPPPLLPGPLPPFLAVMQMNLLNTMQDVSKLDSTISAMCQRRSQLQSQVVTEQVCMYECLAAHTASGSLTMQGALGGESGRVPTPPPMPVQKRA